ncbi:MAG: DUF6383 domain-containing protein [Tannerellaceae bacterium]|nr:DUF6383 domain-containing protein [Tannerellaceae bacterium]
MKRLCFVLTVLLLQVSIPWAYGQEAEKIKGVPVYEEGMYSGARNYLLRATYKGSEGEFFVMEKEGYVYLLPSTQMPESPEGLNAILWKVTVEKGEDDISGFSYRFHTGFSNRDLIFRLEEATASGASSSSTANRLMGDIAQWLPSSKSGSPADNIFYHVSSGGKSVIVWGADGQKVVPRVFKTLAEAENARDVLTITPCKVDGYIPYSVNELNTNSGKHGTYDEASHDVRATWSSEFQISFAASGQIVPGVLKERLQAQGVKAGVGEGVIALAEEAYRVSDREWYSLLIKDKGYIVATASSTGVLELSSTDKWYDKASLPVEAYLFKVLYDGNTGQVFVRSKLKAEEDLAPGTVAFYVGGENQYVPATVNRGVYLIQIVGINDNRNSWSDETHPRRGKYLTFLPDGSFAFAEYGEHLRKDPAAQWIIEESTGGEVLVTNRERGKYSVPYLGDDPHHVFKGKGTGTVFFLGTDTLRFMQLTSDCLNDSHAGYRHFVSGLSGEGFTFKHYQGEGNLGVALSGEEFLSITKNDARIYPEFVATETYGYTTPSNTALVPLERSIYKLKYEGRYISFDPDVSVNRRYFLQDNPEEATVFLLKETWRTGNGEQQYQLFNAPYVSGPWAEIDEATGKYITLHTNGVISSGKTLVMAKLSGGSYVPIEYETKEEIEQLGNWVKPVAVKGTSRFYAGYGQVLSWLAINGAGESAVNVTDENYPKGEFAIQDHYPSLYRSLVSEDVKEEQEVRIETALTSAALVPQSSGSALSYLALEDRPQGNLVARYVRGVKMPQYLLMSDVEERVVGGKTERTARVLRSLADSVSRYRLEGKDPEAFLWEGKPRLAFIEGTLSEGDTKLTIAGETIRIGYSAQEQQTEGESSPLLFSLRLAPEGDGFLLETRGDVYSYYGSGLNSWIKIVDGVPVLYTSTYEDAIQEGAEIFTLRSSTLKVEEVKEEPVVKVLSGERQVVVVGASGKKVTVVNLLGQRVVQKTVSGEEAALDVPPGIVIVTVEGEKSAKVFVR